MAEPPDLDIRLLGEFRLAGDGLPSGGFTSPRLQLLLAYLLLHREAPQPRSRLAFLFWPDSPEAQALANLRSLVLRLRDALPQAEAFLAAGRVSICWRSTARFRLDVAVFEDAARRAALAYDGGADADALAAYAEAAANYGGDLLPGCYDEWVEPERERLRALFATVAERLTLLHERRRDYSAALAVAARLLAHDPLREESYRTLMRLYALADDLAAALGVYERCVRTLDRELGAEPSAATRALYEQLARAEAPAGDPAGTQPDLLVGRGAAWAALLDSWRATRAQRRMVVIAGEAGIGKTRLAEELLGWASRQGLAVAAARCYASDSSAAYAPLAAWLRAPRLVAAARSLPPVVRGEIARLVPELLEADPALAPPGPLTESWQRQRFHQALVRLFGAAGQPMILLLDDAQWCDRETLSWLHTLLRANDAPRLLVVATVRAEALVADHPLEAVRVSLARDGRLDEIALAPLDEAESLLLAAQVSGQQIDTALQSAVYAETEGNPLFIVETARAWAGAPYRPPNERGPLPATLQAVIGERLGQLSPGARELAALGATIGRRFSLELLARAATADLAALAAGLDELCARRVLREHGDAAYDFTHDRLREVVYGGLSSVRRRLLHRSVALALEGFGASQAAGQTASHFVLAGMPERALAHYVRAAEAAARVYAHADAAELYGRALEIARAHHSGAELTTLFLARGRSLELDGRYGEAVALYYELEALGRGRADARIACAAIARLVEAHVVLPSGARDHDVAARLLARGLALVRDLDAPDLEAHLLWGAMFLAATGGRVAEAMTAAERAIDLARRHRLHERLALVLHDGGTFLRWSGDAERGAAWAEEARRLFRAQGNLTLLGDNLSQQAQIDLLHLRLDDALAAADEAIRIAEQIGASSNHGFALSVRGLVWRARGELSRAQRDFCSASHLAQQAGTPMWRLSTAAFGGLLRDLGQLDQARRAHAEAHAGCDRESPFLLKILESQLALDAYASGDPLAAAEWMRRAEKRDWPPDLVIADATSYVAACVAAAEVSGEWLPALRLVDESLAVVRARGLVLFVPELLVLRGRCQLGLEQPGDAEESLHEALVCAEHRGLTPISWQAGGALARLLAAEGRANGPYRERALAALELLLASLDDPEQRASLRASPSARALLAG